MNKRQIYEHMNTFKVTKNIAAGQEFLVRYGSAQWFESKNVPYSDFDYASTMWRPDLHPLPCRKSFSKMTGVDGRHKFAVLGDTMPSGTLMDVSLCVDVPVTVVDQFPVLWDFVIMGETPQTVCARLKIRNLIANPVYSYKQISLFRIPRRYASLCHTPRKSRPHPILFSLMCACHFQTWTKMCVSVVRAFFLRVYVYTVVCEGKAFNVGFF